MEQNHHHGYLTGINTMVIKQEKSHCQGYLPEIKPDG